MRPWQDRYGDPLVDEVRARVRERDWKRAVRGVLVLLRYHPLGLALPNERRIERRKLAQELAARKQKLKARKQKLNARKRKLNAHKRKLKARKQKLETRGQQLRELESTLVKERQEVQRLRKRTKRLTLKVQNLDQRLQNMRGSRTWRFSKRLLSRLGNTRAHEQQIEKLRGRLEKERRRSERLRKQNQRLTLKTQTLTRQVQDAGRAKRHEHPPPVGQVRFGSLRQVEPISHKFGFDRGQPIDRYYIETFLDRHAEDIRGRVLEIGDASYTRQYGGSRVKHSDVLNVAEGNPQATIIADLTRAEHIPSDAFDCIIFTQTLHLIYDLRSAIRTLHRILKPGGVLLATFPGISQIERGYQWGDWYWAFTTRSARQLFEETFLAPNVEVEAHGNVLAAISFLHGLAVEELRQEELDRHTPAYELLITLRAVKETRDTPLISRWLGRLRRTARQPGDRSGGKVLILMYHRVAEPPSDPWALAVEPRRFAEHLEVLRQHARPMRLRQLSRALLEGDLPDRSVIVTFDDGYVDNLHNAKPLLEHYDIPATVFLTTGYIGHEREFWWDELDRLLLRPGALPESLSLTVNGSTYQWELGEAAHYSEEASQRHRRWRAWEEAPSSRHSLYKSLWELLHSMTESARRGMLRELQGWAGTEPASRPGHRPLSLKETVALAQGRMVEVGAHTVTHPALSTLPAASQRDEILSSKARLEELLGRQVTSFAYPHGDLSVETAGIVREAGFARACSTRAGLVELSTDPFRLPRVQVQDWDGDEFARRLSRWFDG